MQTIQDSTIRKTPLHSWHVKNGASMVSFNGWEMPIQYEGILAEHEAVRKSVGIFDVSHMGVLDVLGLNALDLVQELITNDAGRLTDGKALYSPVCLPSGGVLDDVLVYRMEPKRYRFVVNAGNRQKDLEWFLAHAREKHVEIQPMSEEISLVAVQGPNSRPLLEGVLKMGLAALGYYYFFFVDYKDSPLMVSRTGYTGEVGYELFVPAGLVGELWETLLDHGKRYGIKPVGLGARDTLRMEMGYCLYGHEIDETITPLEAGLAWTVSFQKAHFLGKEALVAQKEGGVARKLVGLKMMDKTIPRAGFQIIHEGKSIGKITSGGFSPSLANGIALGYVPKEVAHEGKQFAVRIRAQDHPATIVQIPFYQPQGDNYPWNTRKN